MHSVHLALPLGVSEAVRYPVGTLLLESQILFDHIESSSNTEVGSVGNLSHCLSPILLDDCPDVLDFCCSVLEWLTRVGQIIDLNASILESSNHLWIDQTDRAFAPYTALI